MDDAMLFDDSESVDRANFSAMDKFILRGLRFTPLFVMLGAALAQFIDSTYGAILLLLFMSTPLLIFVVWAFRYVQFSLLSIMLSVVTGAACVTLATSGPRTIRPAGWAMLLALIMYITANVVTNAWAEFDKKHPQVK
jgi:hypothetical protein